MEPKTTALFVASFMFIVFVGIAQASQQVIVEYFTVEDVSRFRCPECGDVVGDIIRVNNIVRGVDWEYGDLVSIEWFDIMTMEGREQFQQYNLDPTKIPVIIVNYTYRMDGKDITRETLKSVIDAYLEGKEPAPIGANPFNVLYSDVSFGFSLGVLSGFSPCLMAMLAFILTYTTGASMNLKDGVFRALVFGSGLATATLIIGLAFLILSVSFVNVLSLNVLTWVGSAIMILTGLNLVNLFKLPRKLRRISARIQRLAFKHSFSFLGLFFLGALFLVVKWNCVAPFIFVLLAKGSFDLQFLLPYIIGVLVPFLGVGLVGGGAPRLAKRIGERYKLQIRVVSGLILIAYGIWLVLLSTIW